MQFTTAAAALMLSSVCSAAVLPREDKPAESQKFIAHARAKGADNFDGSCGYLFAEYVYGGGYVSTLHTEKSDAIVGSISDSALTFGDEYPKSFKLYELSEQSPNSLPQILSYGEATPGMAIEDGLLVWNSPDEVPISWFACENWALEWGPATALFYKWANTTTTEGCADVDLVVEYV